MKGWYGMPGAAPSGTSLLYNSALVLQRVGDVQAGEQGGLMPESLGKEGKAPLLGFDLATLSCVIGTAPSSHLPRKDSVTSALHPALLESALVWGMQGHAMPQGECQAGQDCHIRSASSR